MPAGRQKDKGEQNLTHVETSPAEYASGGGIRQNNLQTGRTKENDGVMKANGTIKPA